MLGFLQKKDKRLIPFQSYDAPTELQVGAEDGELYWKDRKIKRSNFSGPRLGAFVLGIVTGCGVIFSVIANWDKIQANLGSGGSPSNSAASPKGAATNGRSG